MESIFFCGGEEEQTINRRKIFGEGKYVFLWSRGKSEKEKEENSWRRRISFSRRRIKT